MYTDIKIISDVTVEQQRFQSSGTQEPHHNKIKWK